MDTERSREEFRPYLWAVISPRAVPATAIFIRGNTAATLNYISPKVGGFSFGLQYSYAWKFYSVGDREAFGNQDPAYVLSNSDYSLLNNNNVPQVAEKKVGLVVRRWFRLRNHL